MRTNVRLKKTIIFDFDGTIAETQDALIEIYNRIAPEFDCKQVRREDKEILRGKRPQEFLKEYGISRIKLPFLVLKVRSELRKQLSDIKVKDGIYSVLTQLKNEGCTLGIVASNSRGNISSFLGENGLSSAFDFVYTGKHVFSKHRIIKRVLKEKQLNKNAVIFVGDETRDIDAAKKVGIPVIAVSWGFNIKEILQIQNPDLIADKPQELIEIIKSGIEALTN